ncbi:futalosine hydrolase, partial [bacterium]|nr:futalosine hydrolase [bacterium]
MKTLVLIPTDLERRQLAERLADVLDASDGVELCGFGPVAAAARTAGLLATLQPRRVV